MYFYSTQFQYYTTPLNSDTNKKATLIELNLYLTNTKLENTKYSDQKVLRKLNNFSRRFLRHFLVSSCPHFISPTPRVVFRRNFLRSQDCGMVYRPRFRVQFSFLHSAMNEARRRTATTKDAQVTPAFSSRKIRNKRRAVAVTRADDKLPRITLLLYCVSPFEPEVQSQQPPFLATFYPRHVAATENITERIPFRGWRCLRGAVLCEEPRKWIFASSGHLLHSGS